MATLENDTLNANFLTAMGGTINSNDDLYLVHGTQSYTAGADFSSGAKDVASITFGPGWYGNLDSEVLEIDCDQSSTGVVYCGWSGKVIRIKGGNSGVLNKVVVEPAQGGTVYIGTTATQRELEVRAGICIIEDGCDSDTITVDGGLCDAMLDASNAFGTASVWAGTFRVARDGATLNIGAGGNAISYDTTFAPTTINNDGRLTVDRIGTVGTYNGRQGSVCDCSRMTEDATFSAGKLSKGATLILPKGGATLTYSGLTLDPGAIIK